MSNGKEATDVAAPETMRALRGKLAALAKELGLEDLDLSTVTGPHRRLTQEVAGYVYDLDDAQGRPAFAGIRYISRPNPSWELWAVFHDRMRHEPSDVAEPIRAYDSGLAQASALLGLRVEQAEQRRHRSISSTGAANVKSFRRRSPRAEVTSPLHETYVELPVLEDTALGRNRSPATPSVRASSSTTPGVRSKYAAADAGSVGPTRRFIPRYSRNTGRSVLAPYRVTTSNPVLGLLADRPHYSCPLVFRVDDS